MKAEKAAKGFIFDQLRFLCCDCSVDASDATRTAQKLDGEQLIKMATDQRVLGFLSATLEKRQLLKLLNRDTVLKMNLGMCYCEREFERHQAQLQEIALLVSQYDIEIIPFKGIGLASDVYQDIPYRLMGDIDFFVRRRDARKTYDLLIARGFQRAKMPCKNRWQAEILSEISLPYPFEPYGREAFVKEGWNLDIHVDPQYYVGREIITVDFNAIWKNVERLPGPGYEVMKLNAEDHAWLLILHAVDFGEPRFAQILDIALVMKKFHIRKDAIMLKIPNSIGREGRRILEDLIVAVEEFLDPEKGREELSSKSAKILDMFWSQKRRGAMEQTLSSTVGHTIGALRQISTLRERIKFLAGYFVPNPTYYRYECKSLIGSYLKHWVNLLKSVFKCLTNKIRKAEFSLVRENVLQGEKA